jgi:hypothetical protein
MNYSKITREHELKNKVFDDCFGARYFTWTQEVDNIDFIVNERKTGRLLLWAESKLNKTPVMDMLTQLLLTIKKPYGRGELPPPFIGCFDREQIVFVPFNTLLPLFSLNDFNWNIAPSNYSSPEFKKAQSILSAALGDSINIYNFVYDGVELCDFIKKNIYGALQHDELAKTSIDKNNFIIIYHKWLAAVKPTINVNWELAKNIGLMDSDFYLADLLSVNNKTIHEKLNVLLKENHYSLYRKVDEYGLFSDKKASFTDSQQAHSRFWQRYERPPKEEYHDYILTRRDLLMPQDVRERKGSYFTPQIWVEKSQRYLAEALGENWQDEYYIWDCAAGTGNLLEGLTNPRHIFASTLDKADVDVMHERIANGANLLPNHVFQFDFLNDSFEKLPPGLKAIVDDEQKRKKLVVYINPPYAEAGNAKTNAGTGKNKAGVSTQNLIYAHYKSLIRQAGNEVFALFLTHLYTELKGCIIGEFSKLKTLQGPNFAVFRQFFKAKLLSMFVVPANTFDNVTGNFPIGFKVWDTGATEVFTHGTADVYSKDGNKIGEKAFFSNDDKKNIGKWLVKFKDNSNNQTLGAIKAGNNDFQNQNGIYIQKEVAGNSHYLTLAITQNNLIPAALYFAVRKVIPATWLNDRDQFLWPCDGWQANSEFQNNCLVYTLFNTNIQAAHGVNHWIPFTEQEVGARAAFESDFMVRFMHGKLSADKTSDELIALEANFVPSAPLLFTPEAEAVLTAGRALWSYYHAVAYGSREYLLNAAFYDIRAYFQGRNDKGRMNAKSADAHYNELLAVLRSALKILTKEIEPKVYQYEFLLS